MKCKIKRAKTKTVKIACKIKPVQQRTLVQSMFILASRDIIKAMQEKHGLQDCMLLYRTIKTLGILVDPRLQCGNSGWEGGDGVYLRTACDVLEKQEKGITLSILRNNLKNNLDLKDINRIWDVLAEDLSVFVLSLEKSSKIGFGTS